MTPIEGLAALLRPARRVLVFTGAGISTASGIPDYRGPQGVWKRRQPVYYQAFLSSHDARVEYWDFKLEGWPTLCAARPTPVHDAIVALEKAGRIEAVVTQNVDGLHERAGTSRERLVEVHGTDRAIECQSCRARSDPAPHFERFARDRTPPLCAECGGFLKPATISFGQGLREDDLRRAFAAADRADLVLALGSTLGVYPAAGVPLRAAERGVPCVVVNRGPTEHDDLRHVTLRLDGDVQEIVPAAISESLRASPT